MRRGFWALSVTMAWVYANTRRSLVPVMLLHAAVNNTKDIVPSVEPGTPPYTGSRPVRTSGRSERKS